MNRTNMNAWMPRLLIAVASLACFGAMAQVSSAADEGDPPIRVGRLAYYSGEVSYSPAGDEQWVAAQINRPIVIGDRLWSDQDGRVEVSIDDGSWYLGPLTSVTVSNLDDRTTQLQLQQGTLDVTLRRLQAGNVVEIDTPNVAFSLTRPGRYRIDVDPDGGSTSVTVRSGSGIVYGDDTSYVVTGGQAYRFFGTDLRDNELLAPAPYDAFDRWTAARERRYANSVSARYVSPDVVGYADLDNYGTWGVVASYGNVWFPREVAVGWAPYRDGHWAWIDPWGWTWVDDDSWGYAPFHYGRWAFIGGRWGWVPGPREVHPVYAPALVAFVGGVGVGIGGNVAWFPLGPREVYVPAYRVSPAYVNRVNVTNTTVNVTQVTNVYKTTIVNNNTTINNVTYVNRNVQGAVTAVPQHAFATAQPVSRTAVAVNQQEIARGPVTARAAVSPAPQAVFGVHANTANRVAAPPPAVVSRPVIAKNTPPSPLPSFAARQQVLERNPGVSVPRQQLQQMRAASPPASAPRVITAPPAKPVPLPAAGNRPGNPPANNQPGMNPPAGRPQPGNPPAPTYRPEANSS
ncbi:MAG: hypothetical protein KGL70_10380, partial [Betaproteobacteria bacterium]|nr:hypothetical protein [Betaproteobacteria bacterium]